MLLLLSVCWRDIGTICSACDPMLTLPFYIHDWLCIQKMILGNNESKLLLYHPAELSFMQITFSHEFLTTKTQSLLRFNLLNVMASLWMYYWLYRPGMGLGWFIIRGLNMNYSLLEPLTQKEAVHRPPKSSEHQHKTSTYTNAFSLPTVCTTMQWWLRHKTTSHDLVFISLSCCWVVTIWHTESITHTQDLPDMAQSRHQCSESAVIQIHFYIYKDEWSLKHRWGKIV